MTTTNKKKAQRYAHASDLQAAYAELEDAIAAARETWKPVWSTNGGVACLSARIVGENAAEIAASWQRVAVAARRVELAQYGAAARGWPDFASQGKRAA